MDLEIIDRESKIIDYMDQFPQSNDFLKQKDFLAQITHFTYIYARISRALDYSYSKNLKIQDFIINISSYQEFQKSVNELINKILPILLERLSMLQIFFIKNPNQDSQDQITQLMRQIQNFTQSKYPVLFEQIQTFPCPSKVPQDLEAIQYIIQIFLKDRETYFPHQIVKLAKKYKITHLKPFVGFTGKLQINMISQSRVTDTQLDTTGRWKDFRGLFAYGQASEYLYVGWHGSCSAYDWHCNTDQFFKQSDKDFLPYFPRHWQIHAGFSNVLHYSWYSKQTLDENQSNFQSFEQNLIEQSKGKKYIVYTGHSQGAALAQLACVYHKMINKSTKIMAWSFSLPRVFSQQTSQEVDKIFEINQNSFNLIRQNVFGDPVPTSFTSHKDLIMRIRRVSSILQVFIQQAQIYEINFFRFFGLIENLLEDKEFIDSLKDENDNDGFFKNLKEKMVTSALDAYIVTPLRETYKGNFIEFLLDFTDKKKASILSKLVFKTLMKKCKNDIFNIIPKSAKFRLNINEQTLSQFDGEILMGCINSIAKILSPNYEEYNIEDIIFDSEFDFSLKTEDRDGKIDNPMKFTKTLMKALMIENLQQKYYFKEIDCLGEILEGSLYYSANYGDSGILLQDHLNFHKNNQRMDSLNIMESLFGAQKKLDLKNVDPKLAINRIKDKVLSYFAPYHYGEKELEGSYNMELVVNSQLSRMYGYGQYLQQLSDDQMRNEYYYTGIFKQKKQMQDKLLQNQKRTTKVQVLEQDFAVLVQRIEQRVLFLTDLQQTLQDQINKKDKLQLKAQKYVEQNYNTDDLQKISAVVKLIQSFQIDKNLDRIQELQQLVNFSFFTSTYCRAIRIIMDNICDKDVILNQEFRKFIEDIQQIIQTTESNQIEQILVLHKQFLENSRLFLNSINDDIKKEIQIYTVNVEDQAANFEIQNQKSLQNENQEDVNMNKNEKKSCCHCIIY